MSMQDIEPSKALGSEIGEYLMAFAARCKETLSGPQEDAADPHSTRPQTLRREV